MQRARTSTPYQLLLLEEAAAAAVALEPARQPETNSDVTASTRAAETLGYADANAQADAQADAAAAAAASAFHPQVAMRCREAERQLADVTLSLRGCNPFAPSLRPHVLRS